MNGRYVVRKLLDAVGTMALIVTAAFLFVAFTPDHPESLFAPPGSPPPGSPRDGSTPLVVRYVTWVTELVTVQWGDYEGRAVSSLVADRLLRSATYVVPGALVAYAGGIALGFHSAQTTPLRDRVERLLVYVGFGVPTIVVGVVVANHALTNTGVLAYPFYEADRSPFSAYNLVRSVPPAVVVAVGLLAIQTRHARSEWIDYETTTLVRLVRAKGGGPLTVARHVLRNAAAPLVSVLVSETLGLLVLVAMITERLFEIDGFGALLFTAASERSPGLIIGVTVVTAAVGVGGSLAHDLLEAALDPRVGDG